MRPSLTSPVPFLLALGAVTSQPVSSPLSSVASNAGPSGPCVHTISIDPSNPSQDHTPLIQSAVANLTAACPYPSSPAARKLVFAQGTTYNVYTPLHLSGLSSLTLQVSGNLQLPSDIATVQGFVGNGTTYWFQLSGSDVVVEGSDSAEWGWIDSHGQQWWDQPNPPIENRPHLFSFQVTNGVLSKLKIRKPIAWVFSLSAPNIHANAITIDAKSNTSAFNFNTDGFSATSKNITIENSNVYNGDDCITVGSGASDVTFRYNHCEGGHGASIGSLNHNAAVAGVDIHDISFKDSLYAARFKAYAGGNGYAKDISWKNIWMDNVTYPIYLTSNYYDQETSSPSTGGVDSSVQISNFTLEAFAGTINSKHPGDGSCVSDPCWYYVPGQTGHELVILDLAKGSVTGDMLFKRLEAVFPDDGQRARVICDPSVLPPDETDVGFQCVNGTFVPTLRGL